jgi:tetratricopeptide (TPR) repeat protein
MIHIKTPNIILKYFFLLLAFISYCFPLSAEQIMDSVDPLSVDIFTAHERLRNGFLKDALEAQQNAVKAQEYRDGSTHPSVAPLLNNLATLDRCLARYADAESALKWALAIREKAYGPDDPLVALSLHQLASLYLDWGHWEESEFYEKRALSILRENLSHRSLFTGWIPDLKKLLKPLTPKSKSPVEDSSNPLPLSQAFRLMGEIDLRQAKNDEAIPDLKRSLEAESKELNPSPADHIHTLDLMAAAYLSLKKYIDARSCLEEALKTAQAHFKGNAVEVADGWERLGSFDLSQNHPEKAKPSLKSALAIYGSNVGSYFGYSSLPYVQKLAEADLLQGQYLAAQDLLKKYLETAKQVYGAVHPSVVVGLLDLSQAEDGLGQKEDAQKSLQQALEIAHSLYRDDYFLVQKIQKRIQP